MHLHNEPGSGWMKEAIWRPGALSNNVSSRPFLKLYVPVSCLGSVHCFIPVWRCMLCLPLLRFCWLTRPKSAVTAAWDKQIVKTAKEKLQNLTQCLPVWSKCWEKRPTAVIYNYNWMQLPLSSLESENHWAGRGSGLMLSGYRLFLFFFIS